MTSILIVFPKAEDGKSIRNLLVRHGYDVAAVCTLGSQVLNMADMMNIPILALVENMSYFECGGCGKRHKIFGDSHIEEIAKKHGIKHIFQIPINPEIAKAVDSGTIEDFENDYFKDAKTLL